MQHFRSLHFPRETADFYLSASQQKGLYMYIVPRDGDAFELQIPAYPKLMIEKMEKILRTPSNDEKVDLWEEGLSVHFDYLKGTQLYVITFLQDDNIIASFPCRDVEFLRIKDSIIAYWTV
jgi:hypothetical protein